MNRRLRAPLLACAAGAGLAACGGGGQTSTPAGQAATAPAPPAASATPATGPPAAAKLTLEADPSGQLAYVQKSLTAKAGAVTIDFTNQSPVPHNVAVEQGGRQLGMTPVISGGSRTLTLTLAKGSYAFFCTVDSHRQAGMQGTLTVS